VIPLKSKSHSGGSGSMTKCILSAYRRVQITIKNKKRLYLKKLKISTIIYYENVFYSDKLTLVVDYCGKNVVARWQLIMKLKSEIVIQLHK